MKKFDTLELSTETIRELSAAELDKVAGGVAPAGLTGYYPTVNYPCITDKVCAG